MKVICHISLLLLFVLWAGFSWYRHHTVILNYKTTQPALYFQTDSLLIETDTVALMPLLRKYYSSSRVQQMKQELDYRIRTQKDSIRMDGLSMDIYLDEKRRHRECATINHSEVITLIKTGKVNLYQRSHRRHIEKLRIDRSGTKHSGEIRETYVDAGNGFVLETFIVYERTDCRLPYSIEKTKP